MIEFVEGDMFAVEADIRVNTVNCVGAMGAGVALAFKRRNPEMFKAYQADCKLGKVRPGEMHIWKSLAGEWIVNFPTKLDWRDPSRYEYIETGLVALREYLSRQGAVSVTLPALGCGNGGLDWQRVSVMIQDALSGIDAHVKVFAPSASRVAGHSANTVPTENEIARANEIGFNILSEQTEAQIGAASTVFYKGNTALLEQRWVAVIPSRAPSEREQNAIFDIAVALVRRRPSVVLAAILNNSESESLAKRLSELGANVLLVLPFGALTRRSIVTLGKERSEGSLALLSGVLPSNKWSKQNFSIGIDILFGNSCATIVTDPSPKWLLGRNGQTWHKRPLFFLNYGEMDPSVRSSLAQLNAVPISRDASSGQPKIESILDVCG
jgi:O-acetyl-ADP-ribose deacetylase (regulator of RNase III)